jgi:hypothetical protein
MYDSAVGEDGSIRVSSSSPTTVDASMTLRKKAKSDVPQWMPSVTNETELRGCATALAIQAP